MTPRIALVLKFLAAAVFFVLIQWLVTLLALSSFIKGEIDAQFDHPDSFRLYTAARGQFQEEFSSNTPGYKEHERATSQADLRNHITRKLRIDPGQRRGKVDIYAIRLLSFFGPTVSLTPQQIKETCAAHNDIAPLSVVDDRVEVVVTGPDPQLICQPVPPVRNLGIRWFLPLVYSLVFFLLLTKVSIRSFPAFSDITTKTATMGANIDALDGIRGFAALTVLAEHTGVFKGTGYLGVLLFFTLSGFLLSAPFIQQPGRAVSLAYMSSYLFRRLKRILPMFYVTVTILFLFRGKTPEAFRHYFFLQADNILWTVMQEMVFYLVLPGLMAMIYLLFKERRGYAILFLLAVIVAVDQFLTVHVLALYNEGTQLRAQIGIFATGVLFAYCFYWLVAQPAFQRRNKEMVRQVSSIAGILLFLTLLAFSLKLIPGLGSWTPYTQQGIFAFFSALFILLVVLAPKTWLSTLMGWRPFRAIGLVSYSFYLLHPLVISAIKSTARELLAIPSISGYGMFLLSGLVTYSLAIFAYTYIERPFIRGTRQ